MPTESTKGIREGDSLAAVDLGSNSFHLVVARYEHGEIRVIDRLRDTVRMAMGLRPDGSLEPERQRRALTCLARFGQRLRELPTERVRAVATNTVRQLRSPRAFLLTAETALGHPIEVVSGREEARLIYLGVANGIPRSKQRRLVVDIGGGSTEFIIGLGFEPLETESIQIGCIATTRRFFDDGKLTRKRWQKAQTEIEVELQQFAAGYRARGWSDTIGSSGTVRALGAICAALRPADNGITLEGLEEVRERLLEAGEIGRIRLPALSEDRKAVIAGGALILETVFRAARHRAHARLRHRDARGPALRPGRPRRAIRPARGQRAGAGAPLRRRCAPTPRGWKPRRWHCSSRSRTRGNSTRPSATGWPGRAACTRSASPSRTASTRCMAPTWSPTRTSSASPARSSRRSPSWCARSAAPSRVDEVNALPERLAVPAARLAVLLRLSALLHRGRTGEVLPRLALKVGDRVIRLALPKDWLDTHPLTRVDLDTERKHLAELNLKLQIIAT